MKKVCTLLLSLAAALSLTAPALADAISASPLDVAAGLARGMGPLSYFLVAAVVIATLALLIRFWKRKK